MAANYSKLKVTNLPQGEAEIAGEISLAFLVSLRPESLKYFQKTLKLDGFRPGHIPEDILVKKVGEMAIIEESAELALAQEYENIIKETKLKAIGRPHITVTKLAPGVPLEFKIKVTLEPEFDLPDYKKISKEAPLEGAEEATDKEIEDIVAEFKERKIDPKLKEGEKLEEKIKENLNIEKKHRAQEMRRLKIMDKLIAEVKVEIPALLVTSELERMVGQFKDDLTRNGVEWNKYLEEAKKTDEELRKDWEPKAVERVKAELIIAKIAEEEKIVPDVKMVEHEAKHLLEHFPDADPLRAYTYIYAHLRTQKVLEFLEEIK